MEVQLNELIEAIKTEGLKSGETLGLEALEKAKKEAESIILSANRESDEIIQRAKNEAENIKASGEAAILQASRDLVLNLRKEIETLFSSVISKEVQGTLKNTVLKDAIVAVVKGLNEDKSKLDVMVADTDLKLIQGELFSLLASEMKQGLEIKPFRQINAGFRISMKDGSAFYDFSDDEITQVLSGYLNRNLANIITAK